MITGLSHVAIKTDDLERTARFYTEVLGMQVMPRPDFGFPGTWVGTEAAGPIVHLYAGEPAVAPGGGPFVGSAAVDHFALSLRGFAAFRRRFEAEGRQWREQVIPEIHVWQLFLYDPNGVLVELNFDGDREEGAAPDNEAEHRYIPGENFYRPAAN